MGQLSLYRRYRPQTFGEVVGQAHITRTLQNALIEGRLPHACLFSGPRGTGKTSTARILAKALNCELAPTREPCNVCASCREITEGSSMDVVEIDAASHGSVDDARDLREKVAYASVGGTVKVYIIDECHMLTAAANNALLKVLEEPPPHVFFVFATTEPSKVLQTVQDRCQRYEFRAVGPAAAGLRITQVCDAEGVAIDDAAVALLANRSAGSVRDALGLLDQAMSYAGAHGGTEGPVVITAEEVARLFASVPSEVLFEAIDLISERDAGACFGFTDRLIRSGQEPREFLRALVDHLRSLFLVQHAAAPQEILDVPDDQLNRYKAQANRFDPGELLRILDLAGETGIQLRQAVDARLALEIAFARMARPDLHASPPSLLARIERLEKLAGIESADLPASRPAPGPHPAAARHAPPPRPAPPPWPAPAPVPVAPMAPPVPVAPARAPAAPAVVQPAASADLWGPPAAAAPTPAPAAPSPAPAPAPAVTPVPAVVPVPTRATASGWGDPEPSAPEPSAPAPPPLPAPPIATPLAAAPPPPPTEGGDLDIERIRRAWPGVLDLVKKRKITAHAMLFPAQPAEYTHGELVLEYDVRSRFHRDKVSEPGSGYLLTLGEAFFETFGSRPAIRCVLGQNVTREPELVDEEHQHAPPPDSPANPAAVRPAEAPRTGAPATRHKDPIDLIREGFAAEIVEERH